MVMKTNNLTLHRSGAWHGQGCTAATPVWRRAFRPRRAGAHATAASAPSAPALPPQLSTSDTNILAMSDIEAILDWNLRICRSLAPVKPVVLEGLLADRLRDASQKVAGSSGISNSVQQPGVLCPWLPSAAALRELLGSGFAVAGIECGGAAVERLGDDLGLGPEETGVHDGWTRRALPRHAGATPSAPDAAEERVTPAGPPGPTSPTSPQLFVYRGNPYLMTPPVLSLFPYPLIGVWDAWGLLVTPPQLLRRYASVWADVLPSGGVWLAAALVRRPVPGGQAAGAEAQQQSGVDASLGRSGLHAHSTQLLTAVAEHEGFAVEELEVPDASAGPGTRGAAAAQPAAGQGPEQLRTALGEMLSAAAAGCGDASALRLVMLAMTKG